MSPIYIMREYVIEENGAKETVIHCYSSVSKAKQALHDYWMNDIDDTDYDTFIIDIDDSGNYKITIPKQITDALGLYELYYTIEKTFLNADFWT